MGKVAARKQQPPLPPPQDAINQAAKIIAEKKRRVGRASISHQRVINVGRAVDRITEGGKGRNILRNANIVVNRREQGQSSNNMRFVSTGGFFFFKLADLTNLQNKCSLA